MITCDSVSALTNGLKSLGAFNELVVARHHAGYCQRGNRLNEWILRGVWLMDYLGNTSRLEIFPGHKARLVGLPEIMTPETFKELFPEVSFYVDGTFIGIPPAGSVCAKCGCQWTMDNCHLARHHNVSNDTTWIADPRYIGKRYDEIPRATIEPDGLTVRIKSTTLIVKDCDGVIRTSENGLKYDYTFDASDQLPFSIVRFRHVETCS